MPSKRPPSIQKKAYVEIDYQTLNDTGEVKIISSPIIAPTITTKVPRGKFEIVYTAELFGILDKLGNKKIQVLSYLLENKDGTNQLNMTNTEIAKNIGVARKTVIETMKVLESADLLRRKGTVVMLSSNFMVKGNRIREAFLMQKFQEISPKEEEFEDAIPVEVEDQLSITPSGEIAQRAKEVKS